MTLTHIFVLGICAVLYTLLMPARARRWALYVGSVIAIYWLQPATTIDQLDFFFPMATLAITVLAWMLSRSPDQRFTRQDGLAAAVMVGVVLLLSFGRYLQADYRITPSMPPALPQVMIVLVGVSVALVVLAWLPVKRRALGGIAILLILAVFIVLKTSGLAEEAARQLRTWQGQNPDLASASELEWLGFSYVAFRLIHTLRDRQTDRLPELTLRDYVTYVLFFPSFTAGPIDRAERFLADLQNLPGPQAERAVQGGMRIVVGLAKKFVIADSLAYFALDATKAGQAPSTWGLWVMVYTFALQIYFDFSGYSDIAIGIGQLFGIKLPENFSLPYLKRNITLFWQSWHITLSTWVRFYVFSPLSRYLMSRKVKPSPTAVVFACQMATMLAIGLWHGVTWGFVAWGAWHAVGLFIHKVWSDHTRPYYLKLRSRPALGRVVELAGIVITFHFVVVGWVWFALPDIQTGWDVFVRLFGL